MALVLWLALAVGSALFWGLGVAIFFGFSIKLLVGAVIFGVLLATWLVWRVRAQPEEGS